MKKQFEEGLAKAKEASGKKLETNTTTVNPDDTKAGRMIWEIAEAIKDRKIAEGKPSVVSHCRHAETGIRSQMSGGFHDCRCP